MGRISGGTAIIILIALYFVIKWAVKNAYEDITGKEIKDDIDEIMEKDIFKSIQEYKKIENRKI